MSNFHIFCSCENMNYHNLRMPCMYILTSCNTYIVSEHYLIKSEKILKILICSTYLSILSPFMTYSQVCEKSNTMGATRGAGTA
jgi:hypothetical protein